MTASSGTLPGSPALEVSLKAKFRRTQRRRKTVAFLLVAPLFLFIVANFVVPIVVLLLKAIENPEVVEGLPRTVAAIRKWDGRDLPDEPVYAALAEDMRAIREDRGAVGRIAKRLNYEIGGYRAVIFKTVRHPSALTARPSKPALIDVDPHWGDREYWAAIKRNATAYTDHYMLAAIDLTRNADGVVAVPKEEAVFVQLFVQTFWISAIVTALCIVLGYPVAYLLATLPTKHSNILMFFVLLPFWIASLVRTAAWIVLLQKQGVINDLLSWVQITSEPIQLVFNRTGVLIGMVHVMLPFMILPLYSVMKGIDPQHMRAARSLGADGLRAFRKVYFPQTLPGVTAGGLLVFIIAIGFYVTPALLGGAADQMVSSFIAIYTNEIFNWGQASALAVILLVVVAALYAVYHRLVGSQMIRLT